MTALLPLLNGAAGRPALLLDPWRYAAAVLDHAEVPFADTTAMVSLGRRAAGLLRPDALLLPMHDWFETVVQGRAELREAMARRSRTGFALKTALADAALRATFRETVGALCTALPGLPVVPTLGSSVQWLCSAQVAAHGSAPDDIDDDLCEQAQVYLADLLREIGAVPIGGLFIDEPLVPADDHWLEAFTPVVNVCVHYRWSLGVTLGDGPVRAAPPVAWTVGHASPSGLPCGMWLPAGFWQAGAEPPASGAFYLGRPPSDAVPESVLAQRAGLRQPTVPTNIPTGTAAS